MDNRRKLTVRPDIFLKIVELSTITYDDLKMKYHCTIFEGRDFGSAIMMCEDRPDIYATVWIGVNNVSLMVNKEEIKSFKFLMQ